jgi:hypothetical protein
VPCLPWLSACQLTVYERITRICDYLGLTTFPTLTDAEAFPAHELAELYLRRWSIELWWRHIKTSMGMETLSCLSPAMAHKELEMYLIAYNLIRCLMVEAGALHERPIERFSFKGATDAVRQFSPVDRPGPRRQTPPRLDPKTAGGTGGRSGPGASRPPRAPSRQAPTQTLPIIDKTSEPVCRNPPPGQIPQSRLRIVKMNTGFLSKRHSGLTTFSDKQRVPA